MLAVVTLPDIDDVAARVLRAAQMQGPPTDLSRVISCWPNLRLVEEDLEGEGYLLRFGRESGEIVVRASAPQQRKRFTIAHELGHWQLPRVVEVEDFGRTPHHGHAAVERWCDGFAARLLMPREWMDEYLGDMNSGVSLRQLVEGPSVFDVSVEAFLLRVSEISGTDIVRINLRSARARPQYYLSSASPLFAERLVQSLDVSKLIQKHDMFRVAVEIDGERLTVTGGYDVAMRGASDLLLLWRRR